MSRGLPRFPVIDDPDDLDGTPAVGEYYLDPSTGRAVVYLSDGMPNAPAGGGDTASAFAADSSPGTGTTVHSGIATVAFSAYGIEASVSVTGQSGLMASSVINVSIVADSDDVYAQDWDPPIVCNVVAGTGFDIVLRPEVGVYAGSVKVHYTWV
jgi:hypothetical protein